MSNARAIANFPNQIINVVNKGVDPTGASSATSKIQDELNRMADRGGGNLIVQDGKFRMTAPLLVPDNVTLGVGSVGPFEANASPGATSRAPTFLIDHDDGPAVVLNGPGAGVTDVQFWYPDQVGPSASAPIAFPPTIRFAQGTGSQKVSRCTFGNSYDAIEILSGRSMVSDCLVGAFHNDVSIDTAYDWVELHNVKCQVMWNVFAGALAFPQPIDDWVMSNGIALKTARVDSLQGSNFSVYGRHTGHKMIDSANTGLSMRAGYGRMTNVDFDFVAYGIDATSTNPSAFGFQYANASFGANGSGIGQAGRAVVQTRMGGTQAPIVSVVGGHARGTWAAGSLPPTQNDGYDNGGRIYCSDVRGLNMPGEAGAVVVPASGVQVANFYPYAVDVYLIGGTITDVTHNSVAIGPVRTIRLQPYETLAVFYSAAPTWKWFGS